MSSSPDQGVSRGPDLRRAHRPVPNPSNKRVHRLSPIHTAEKQHERVGLHPENQHERLGPLHDRRGHPPFTTEVPEIRRAVELMELQKPRLSTCQQSRELAGRLKPLREISKLKSLEFFLIRQRNNPMTDGVFCDLCGDWFPKRNLSLHRYVCCAVPLVRQQDVIARDKRIRSYYEREDRACVQIQRILRGGVLGFTVTVRVRVRRYSSEIQLQLGWGLGDAAHHERWSIELTHRP